MKAYKEASGKLKKREQYIQAVVNDFETELEFLGVTGVEDRL